MRDVCVVIGFATNSGMRSFESPGRLSYYTGALIRSLHTHGHEKDVKDLLGLVQAEVVHASAGKQAPCVHVTGTGNVVLVSLVRTVQLCSTASVGEAVAPLVSNLDKQVACILR